MSQASQLNPLQERFAARQSRLHISEIVEQEPPSEFDSVGLELQAHRTRKGHELEMAARVLRINIKHLKAIEDDHFEILPGKTYAVGFVRAYAEYLGLDPEDCVRRFKLEYMAATEPEAEEGTKKSKKMGMAFPDLQEDTRLPTGSIIVVTGLLILGVWGGWYLSTTDERAFSDSSAETTETEEAIGLPSPEEAQAILAGEEVIPAIDPAASETQNTPVEASDVPSETLVEEAVEAESAAEPEATATEAVEEEITPAASTAARDSEVFGSANHDARVILRARGNAWVRIEGEDGTVLFEETLQPGDSFRVPNQNGLILATRNAGAVEMIVDGSSLGPAGSVGQALLNKTLDANVLLADAPQQP